MNQEGKQIKRLYRSRRNRWVAGVAGGMAEYFNLNPVVIRIIWAILLLPGGLPGLIPYLIFWLIMPLEPEDRG